MEILIGVLVAVGLLAAVWWVLRDYLTSEDKARFRTRLTPEQKREERRRRAAEWSRIDRESRERHGRWGQGDE